MKSVVVAILMVLLINNAGADPREAAKEVNNYKKVESAYAQGGKGGKSEGPFNAVKKALNPVLSSNDESSVKYIVKLLSDKNAPNAAKGYAMRQAAKNSNDALTAAIKKEVMGGRAAPQLIDVMARIKDKDCAPAFGKYASSNDPITQMAGLMGLAHSGGIKDIALVNRLGSAAVGARRQGLRWAACRALGSSVNKAAVPHLIKCLDLPGGYKEARHALIRLSGNSKSSSKGEWTEWWKANHKTFQPVDKPDLADETLKSLEGDTEFYGLEIEGDPVVFMLDASNSMKGAQWERLQKESEQMFQTLPYELEFAIVMFPLNTFPKKGYVNNKSEEAITFVKYIELRGSTPMAQAAYVGLNNHMGKGRNLPDTAPADDFKGKSGISTYVDFVIETDHRVGQIVDAVDKAGISENTLIIFTADNGTSLNFASKQNKTKVNYNYNVRGGKADIWEGGHKVPFVFRWKGKVKAGLKNNTPVCLTDIMATAADLLKVKLPDDAAEDSVSLLPALNGEALQRAPVINHSISGKFAIRNGDWKLIFAPGSGGWSKPKDAEAQKSGLPGMQLYNIKEDPKEQKNMVNDKPELVKNLTKQIYDLISKGRSTPGTPQKNAGTTWLPEL